MKPIFKPNRMNKTEQEYAQRLEIERRLGKIIDYYFESIKLRLAHNTTYTPDFMVVFEDRFEFHEVKGFWRDDARVKIKVAAEKYLWFKFVAVKLVRGAWEYEEIK